MGGQGGAAEGARRRGRVRPRAEGRRRRAEGGPRLIHWALQAGAEPAACAPVDALSVAERARLAGFGVPKRRADWLMGRLAAKAVVAAALADAFPGPWPLAAIEIPSDPSGMPYARLAPEAGPAGRFAPGDRLPVTVSISHAEAHALCAAARHASSDGGHRALGADLGRVEPRSPAFVATFFTEDEQRFVRDAGPRDRDLRANLVWCAKEAVLKALGLGLTVDTRALSCLPVPGAADDREWPMAPAVDGWRPFVAACGPALAPRGLTIRGIWRAFPGFVGALASAAA